MRYIIILSVVATISFSTQAQPGNQGWKKYRHEVSIGYGLNTFLSRIGATDKFGLRPLMQRSTFNASYRYYFMKHFAVRGSLTHAYARKNDKIGDPLDAFADVDYEMTITELAAICEYHILDETTRSHSQGKVRRARGGVSGRAKFGVSVFAGVALDRFRPFGELNGAEVVLRPYDANAGSVEVGDYRKTNLHIPVGAQVRLLASPNWRVGFEAGYRIGFRPYVDNLSTVYYTGESPHASEFSDTQFTGLYTTVDDDLNAPIAALASREGRSSYFFGLLTLAYRIKS